MELRIDAQLPQDAVESELQRLHARLSSPGDMLHGIAAEPLGLPGMVLRHREADGEQFVYVEDVVRRRLAGYVVFNRLVELDRRADRHLRGPHSKIAAAYQRCGVATAVYGWGLIRGICLISGPRQSPGAHALWRTLGKRHPLGFVQLRHKSLRWLGTDLTAQELEDFHTRMVILGAGWTFERFLECTRCRVEGQIGLVSQSRTS